MLYERVDCLQCVAGHRLYFTLRFAAFSPVTVVTDGALRHVVALVQNQPGFPGSGQGQPVERSQHRGEDPVLGEDEFREHL